jgi:very-short-patch-repair endonuclease
MEFCICGCGKIVLKENSYCRGHWNKGKTPWNKGKTGIYSEETKIKMSETRKGKIFSENHKKNLSGKIPWNKGKTGIYSEETKIKMKNKNPIFFSEEIRKKISDSKKGKPSWNKGLTKDTHKSLKIISNKLTGREVNSLEHRERSRQKMLNGQSLMMIKKIKKISNEEIKLRNMVKELYPECEFQYGVFGYALDVAIVEQKIAIEYDGYYHFNSKESIIYYQFRKEKIEKQGWKFLTYTMFDVFPDTKKLREDIEKLIKGILV